MLNGMLVRVFTDRDDDILFLSLESIDWAPNEYIDTRAVENQIRGDSTLRAMPAASTLSKPKSTTKELEDTLRSWFESGQLLPSLPEILWLDC
jgi:hypothetical protein